VRRVNARRRTKLRPGATRTLDHRTPYPVDVTGGGRSYGRYVAFQMAEVAIPRNLFADILRLIAVAPDRSFEVSKREPFMLVHRYSAPEQTKTRMSAKMIGVCPVVSGNEFHDRIARLTPCSV
jgi:hypothetical protein